MIENTDKSILINQPKNTPHIAFDVILPTIMRPTLEETVNSVFHQTYKNWRLLWAFDIEMGTPFILEGYNIIPTIAPPVTCVCLDDLGPHNDNGTTARNKAISIGHNPWIVYIDDDDIWLTNHLETMANLIALHSNANMFKTAGQQFKWGHRHPRSSKLVKKLGPINSKDVLTVGMCHSRELFNKTNGWINRDNHDAILWHEMLDKGGIPIYSDTITFQFAKS